MTFETWFKFQEMPQVVTGGLIEMCFPGETMDTNCLYYVEVTFDGMILIGHEYDEGLNEKFFFDTNIQPMTWYHLAVTRNGDAKEYAIYLNGERWPGVYKYVHDPEVVFFLVSQLDFI